MDSDKLQQIRDDAELELAYEFERERIKEWFLRHYEDPAQNTPYDSGEGGYLYQWGGPFDAADVLYEKFGGEVDDKIIEEVSEDLARMCEHWERVPSLDDYDPSDFASAYLSRFEAAIASIHTELLKIQDDAEDSFMCAMLFAHTITCLEAYLSDSFLTFIKRPQYLRAFVETDPELGKEKLTLSEVYRCLETLDTVVMKRIHSIVFHRLEVVQRMFKSTLGVELPAGMSALFAAVTKRHDIVHRGCVDKGGSAFTVSKREVSDLVAVVSQFVGELDRKLEKIK